MRQIFTPQPQILNLPLIAGSLLGALVMNVPLPNAVMAKEYNPYGTKLFPISEKCTVYSPGGDAGHKPEIRGKCVSPVDISLLDFVTARQKPNFLKSSSDNWPEATVRVGKAGGGDQRTLSMKMLTSVNSKVHANSWPRFGQLEEGRVGIFANDNELWIASSMRANTGGFDDQIIGSFSPWQRSADGRADAIKINSFVAVNDGEIWFETSNGQFEYIRVNDAITAPGEASAYLIVYGVQRGKLNPPEKAQYLGAAKGQNKPSVIPTTASKNLQNLSKEEFPKLDLVQGETLNKYLNHSFVTNKWLFEIEFTEDMQKLVKEVVARAKSGNLEITRSTKNLNVYEVNMGRTIATLPPNNNRISTSWIRVVTDKNNNILEFTPFEKTGQSR